MVKVEKKSEFHSKDDFEIALDKLLAPVFKLLKTTPPGLLKIGTSGTVYGEKTRQAEGFLRLLWGLGPYYAQREVDENFVVILTGIIAGVDPTHSSYWGDIADYHQLMVEMAPLAVFLLLNQAKVLSVLSEKEQSNLSDWLNQINDYQPSPNNWLFFRVLVNVALKRCFGIDQRKQIDQDLNLIEGFYLGNGWYYDGKPHRKDYYVSFAIHYYSLIYARFFEKEDPERAMLYKDRSCQFAESFQYWFDREGRALPFGRSLIYRFAQSSFWAAMIFADVKGFPQKNSKYLLAANLKHWLEKDIFSPEGFLEIGYYYQNLNMAEEYNGPGSPYWALKAFLILALPQEAESWQLAAEAPQLKQDNYCLNEADMLLVRNQENTDVQSFVTNQFCEQHAHGEAKYSKFVYSTNFGFSVPKGIMNLERGGFDNCLVVSEQDDYYRMRTRVSQSILTSEFVYSVWQPWPDVTIYSVVVPLYPWHVRLHYVESKRKLRLSDGGFSMAYDESASVKQIENEKELWLAGRIGQSAIKAYDKRQTVHVSHPQPNVNLLCNSVVIPYILTDLEPGEYLLGASFLGACESISYSAPTIDFEKNQAVIRHQKKEWHWSFIDNKLRRKEEL